MLSLSGLAYSVKCFQTIFITSSVRSIGAIPSFMTIVAIIFFYSSDQTFAVDVFYTYIKLHVLYT